MNSKRRLVAVLLPATIAYCGSPLVAIGNAQAGGADKQRPATFGDCKNSNAGVHNGYDCEAVPTAEGSGGGTSGGGGIPL